MTTRIDKHEYFMSIAIAVASRSTCPRRAVGAIIVDESSRIMATGYNGAPRGFPHCIDSPCLGAGLPSGSGLDLCMAVHAEQNALAQCSDTMKAHAIYTTAYPCVHCLKQLLNTSIREIIYMRWYPNNIVLPPSVKQCQVSSTFLHNLERSYDAITNRDK